MPQSIIAGSGIACGAVAMLAQALAHPEASVLQLAQIGGTGGLIICLIIAVKHVTKQRDEKESKIVSLLETAVTDNTKSFDRFSLEIRSAADLNTQQAKKICELLQAILYEFRDGTEKEQKHGHNKTHKS